MTPAEEERYDQWDEVLGSFQVGVAEFVRRFDTDTPARAMKFAEEAGELVGAVTRLLEGRGSVGDVKSEAGDVAITLASLLDSVDVALTDAVFHRWNEIQHRDWPHLTHPEPVHPGDDYAEITAMPSAAPEAPAPDEVADLRRRLIDLERDLDEALRERDDAHEWADKLAYSISPIEVIGEHSSGNNPWWNALHGEAAE